MKNHPDPPDFRDPPATHDAVPLNGGPDLFRAWGDVEGGLGLDAVLHGLFGQGGAAAHVLVRGVGARADQTCRKGYNSVVSHVSSNQWKLEEKM